MELGSGEILLILVVALLIYGGRLPEVARAVGHSLGELKRGLTETKDAVASQVDPGLRGVSQFLEGSPLHDDSPLLDDAGREVRRIGPAPEHLAKEDISSPPEPKPASEPPPPATPG